MNQSEVYEIQDNNSHDDTVAETDNSDGYSSDEEVLERLKTTLIHSRSFTGPWKKVAFKLTIELCMQSF